MADLSQGNVRPRRRIPQYGQDSSTLLVLFWHASALNANDSVNRRVVTTLTGTLGVKLRRKNVKRILLTLTFLAAFAAAGFVPASPANAWRGYYGRPYGGYYGGPRVYGGYGYAPYRAYDSPYYARIIMHRVFTPLIRTITTVVIRIVLARTITDRELALPFRLDTKLLGSARFSAAPSRAARSADRNRSHDAGTHHQVDCGFHLGLLSLEAQFRP